MPSAKVSQEEMLSAPKSFKRFLASKRAIEGRERRKEEKTLGEGEDARARARAEEAAARASSAEDESDEEDGGEGDVRGKEQNESSAGAMPEDEIKPMVRAKPDQGTEELRALDERAVRERLEKEATGKKKKKYLSLRERKRKDRAALRAQKQEEETFLRGTGGGVKFGETVDAPPTITLKRKSGGKGEKEVPIAQSGHKIVQIAEMQTGGKSNRQSKIFEDLLAAAQKDSGKSSKKTSLPSNVGLKRQYDLAQLRAQVIADYRQMKGRPMTNGRNEKLAQNPIKLFGSGVSAEQLRKDRRTK